MKLSLTKLLLTPCITSGVFGIYYVKSNGGLGFLAYGDPDLFITELKGYEERITTRRIYKSSIPSTVKGPNIRSRRSIKGESKNAIERINIIKDYSVQIVTPCGTGTGWFLDYVLKNDQNEYPTTWFIATNAHVVEHMYFKNNLYKQLLPKKNGVFCINPVQDHTPIALFKERPSVNSLEKDNYPEIWRNLRQMDSGYKNIQRINGITKEEEITGDLLYYVDLNPQLLYASINFMGSNARTYGYTLKRSNYYKDFAVLEVNFETEFEARTLTRDFYHKYDYQKGTDRSKALNFFAEELLYRKTGDEILKEDEDFFVAGYASNGHTRNEIASNYSRVRNAASKLADLTHLPSLSEYVLRNKYHQPIIGHMNVGLLDDKELNSKTALTWGGYKFNDWGYNYVIDNSHLSSGASGSLTTDDEGNVFGLYRMHGNFNKHGFIEPLRSRGIYKAGKILYPPYDLIEGTKFQISSYKSQIQKYFLKDNKETALSKLREWKKRENTRKQVRSRASA